MRQKTVWIIKPQALYFPIIFKFYISLWYLPPCFTHYILQSNIPTCCFFPFLCPGQLCAVQQHENISVNHSAVLQYNQDTSKLTSQLDQAHKPAASYFSRE